MLIFLAFNIYLSFTRYRYLENITVIFVKMLPDDNFLVDLVYLCTNEF